MTNLEGRVILRERAVAPPDGRAHRPRGARRRWPSGSGRPGTFGTDPEAVFAELGGPRPGAAADYAGIDYDRIRAEHGVFWPCPTPDHPGTPRLFADPSPPPTAGPASSPSSTAAPPEAAVRRTTRVHLTTGRVLAQYQSGAQTRRVRELPDDGPFVELHPMLADRIGAARRRAGRGHHPARRAQGAGPGGRHDPPGHGVRAVPLGRRQPAHQRRARPAQPDAGVQGLCRGEVGTARDVHREVLQSESGRHPAAQVRA